MSQATLPREARRSIVAFFAAGKEAKQVSDDPTSGFTKTRASVDGHDVLQIRNMPVFRSGTFRDSYGIQHTWDDIHMDHMVQNFELLKSRSLLEHLPVRKGHPGFLTTPAQATDEIIGYHSALRTARMTNPADGKEYNYLFADYDILDPDAIDKIDRGQWRNMSAEVGHWFTNDEAEYWPVYSGVAYCDFSAVEGLKNFASANGVGTSFSIMSTEQEQNVAGEPNGQTGTTTVPPTPPGVPTPPVPPQNNGGAPATTGTQTETPAPVVQHAAPQQLFAFTVGGQQITDFAAVQQHLQRLEQENTVLQTTFKEQREAGRKAFVKRLADANLVTAGDEMTKTEKFALELSDEHFAIWQGQWAHALPKEHLGVTTGGGTNFQAGQQTPAPGAGSPAVGAPNEIETAKEVVANFQRTGGMTVDQIKATPSYKKLVAAGQAPELG
jgi:hypothetical protein